MKKTFIGIFFIFCTIISGFAQSHKTNQAHIENITQIESSKIKNEKQSFYTASEDGYLIKWTNEEGNIIGEHYQLTDLWIKLISVSPNGKEIAIYETNGGSINRVSVWNWNKLQKIYTKYYDDTVTSLKYSSKGNFLIVGTSSIGGVEFLKASNGSKANKLKDNINIVNYIYTSDTEKTAVFYSTSGTLTYVNLQKGEIKTKFSIALGLNQNVLFNESKIFAGVKNNEIYLYNSFKGKLITKQSANNPIIISNENDNDLYYIVKENGVYNINKIVISESLESAKNILVKKININQTITNAKKINNEVILGLKNGEISKIFLESENETDINNEKPIEISKKEYKFINDVSKAPEDNSYYILTEQEIIKTNYDTKETNIITKFNGQKNIITAGNNIVLWNKESISPVYYYDIDKNTSEKLFTPNFQIKNLKYYNYDDSEYLLEIENNGLICLYDIKKRKLSQIYTGTGIQDAVLCSNNNIYIAKSAAIYPNTPLLQVNITTLETVPVNIKGSISFSLETNDEGTMIYGIMFSENESDKHTYVFSYNTENNANKNILEFEEEDTDAFTYFDNTTLFTNIGKNFIYSYNIKKNKKMVYKRSVSIPKYIIQNKDTVLILNNNGSISWAKSSKNSIIEDWYYTNENEWFIISDKK